MQKFTNYRTSWIKAHRRGTSSWEAHDPVKCAQQLGHLARILGGWTNPIELAKALFKKENEEQIQKTQKDLELTVTDANPAGAYQKAVKQLWEASNQEEYKKRALDEVDVEE